MTHSYCSKFGLCIMSVLTGVMLLWTPALDAQEVVPKLYRADSPNPTEGIPARGILNEFDSLYPLATPLANESLILTSLDTWRTDGVFERESFGNETQRELRHFGHRAVFARLFNRFGPFKTSAYKRKPLTDESVRFNPLNSNDVIDILLDSRGGLEPLRPLVGEQSPGFTVSFMYRNSAEEPLRRCTAERTTACYDTSYDPVMFISSTSTKEVGLSMHLVDGVPTLTGMPNPSLYPPKEPGRRREMFPPSKSNAKTFRVDDGKWHHIALTFTSGCHTSYLGRELDQGCSPEDSIQAGSLSLQVDGVEMPGEPQVYLGKRLDTISFGYIPKGDGERDFVFPQDSAISKKPQPNQARLQVSAFNATRVNHLYSYMDMRELKIYSQPLSADEIVTLSNARKQGVTWMYPQRSFRDVEPSGETLGVGARVIAQNNPGSHLPVKWFKNSRAIDLFRHKLSTGQDGRVNSYALTKDTSEHTTTMWLGQSMFATKPLKASLHYVRDKDAFRVIRQPVLDMMGEPTGVERLEVECLQGDGSWGRLGVSEQMPLREWRALTITKNAQDVHHVYVDGHRLMAQDGKAEFGPFLCQQARTAQDLTAALLIEQEEEFGIAWAVVFNRVMSLSEIDHLAHPGPVVWFTLAQKPSLNPTNMAGDYLQVSWNNGEGTGPTNGVLGKDDFENPEASTYLRVPAKGPLDARGRSGHDDSYSIMTRFTLGRGDNPLPISSEQPLLSRCVVGDPFSECDVVVSLVCDTTACDSAVVEYRTRPVKRTGTTLTDFTYTFMRFKLQAPVRFGEQVVFSITSPVPDSSSNNTRELLPQVFVNHEQAIHSSTETTRSDQNGSPLPAAEVDSYLAAGRPFEWNIGPAQILGQFTMALEEARVYSSVVNNLELVGAPCDVRACGTSGQVCYGPQDAASRTQGFLGSAVCGGCAEGQFMKISSARPHNNECVPLRAFGSRCNSGAMCETGKCSQICSIVDSNQVCMPGMCVLGEDAASQAVQESYCKKRHRELVQVERTDGRFGSVVDRYQACDSSACVTDFETIEQFAQVDDDQMHYYKTCKWSPTKEYRQVCERDSECTSGVCVKTNYSDYKTIWGTLQGGGGPSTTSAQKSCATDDATLCASQGAAKQVIRGVYMPDADRSDSSNRVDRYLCSEQCLQGFQPAWTYLSPQACKVASERHTELVTTPSRARLVASTENEPEKNVFIYENGDPYTASRGNTPEYYKRILEEVLNTSDLSMSTSDILRIYYAYLFPALGDVAVLRQVDREGKSPDYELKPGTEGPGFDSNEARASGVGSKLVNAIFQDVNVPRQALDQIIPLQQCEQLQGVYADPTQNHKTCVPFRFQDGFSCPPDYLSSTFNGNPNQFCESNYCELSSKTCQPASTHVSIPIRRTESKGISGKFATAQLVTNQTSKLDIDYNPLPSGRRDPNQWRSENKVDTKYNLLFKLGSLTVADQTVLEVDFDFKRSRQVEMGKVNKCLESEGSLKLFGIDIEPDEGPKPIVECDAFANSDDDLSRTDTMGFTKCEEETVMNKSSCNVNGVKEMLESHLKSIPATPRLCLPVPEYKAIIIPLFPLTGLPLELSAGLGLEACLDFAFSYSVYESMLATQLEQGIYAFLFAGSDLGGGEEFPLSMKVGLKGELNFAKAEASYGVGTKIEEKVDRDGLPLPGQLESSTFFQFDAELSTLSGAIFVLVEFVVDAVLTEIVIEKKFGILEWGGFSYTQTWRKFLDVVQASDDRTQDALQPKVTDPNNYTPPDERLGIVPPVKVNVVHDHIPNR